MFQKKVITLLILIIIIQLFGIIYSQRGKIKSFLRDNFSKEKIGYLFQEFKDQFSSSDENILESVEKFPLKKFKITVSPSEWKRINENITSRSPREEIPATLEVDNQIYECKLRISKGGQRHWKGKRKSLRLRFPNKKLYNGIKEVNLNIPETPRVIIDPLAWDFASFMGLVVPQYDFVRLEVNGINQGVRIFYEDIDKYFLERNGLMGYIFTEKRYHSFTFDYRSSKDEDYPEIKVINKKGNSLEELIWLNKALANPSISQFKEEAEKILDIDEVLTWHAHALICGSGHQNVHNIQLFYNSSIRRFQLIPWDIAGFDHWGHEPRKTEEMALDWCTNRLIFRLNQVPEFVEKRNRIIWKSLHELLPLKKQLELIDSHYKKVRYYIYTDPLKQASTEIFSNRDFDNKIKEMKEWVKLRYSFMINELESADLRVSVNPLPYSSKKKGLMISLGTGKQSGVMVKSFKIPLTKKIDPDKIKLYLDVNGNLIFDSKDREIDGTKKLLVDSDTPVVALMINELLLPARSIIRDPWFDYWDKGYILQTIPAYRYYNFFVIQDSDSKKSLLSPEIKIESINSVTGHPVTPQYFNIDKEKEFSYIYRETETPSRTLFKEKSNTKTAVSFDIEDFLSRYSSNKNIIIPAGTYRINHTLKIGRSKVVTLSPGVHFLIGPGVSIYVRGTLNINGTLSKPVILENAINNLPWGALIYHETKNNSRIDHAVIRNAGMARIDGVNFTGGVSVYDATITISSSLFDHIHADDGINTKNSQTRILGCRFLNSRDDAIDYDFTDGEIKDCYIYKSGGDGIDCGTSNPKIYGNYIDSPVDKCISVGERSFPVIENNFLIGGTYGIAVKDDSNPLIKNNTICENKKGISFYIKKPDKFGKPSAKITQCIIWNNQNEIENLSHSKFVIQKCVVKGGYPGKKIFTDPPEFTFSPNTPELKYVLKKNSLYAVKGYGAKQGNW